MYERPSYFMPFDRMYAEVSRRTRIYHNTLKSETDQYWLANQIWYFQIECDAWPVKNELAQYFSKMSTLDLRVLQLAAGAYLHIAYDLPRVVADVTSHVTSNPNVDSGVFLTKASDIYDDIGQIFPSVISTMSSRADIVGATRLLLGITPVSTDMIEIWIGNLRKGAWNHAMQLYKMPPLERSIRERAILDAITAALDDTSNWRPWSILKLKPPVLSFPRYSDPAPLSIFLPFLTFDVEPSLILLLLALNMVVILFAYRNNITNKKFEEAMTRIEHAQDRSNESKSYQLQSDRDNEEAYNLYIDALRASDKEISEFIEEFGKRVDKYTSYALENPGGFDDFRRRYSS